MSSGGLASLSHSVETACAQNAARALAILPSGEAVRFDAFFLTIARFAETLAGHGVGRSSLAVNAVIDPLAGLATTLALLRLGATVLPELLEPIDRQFRLCLPTNRFGEPGEIVVDGSWLAPPSRIAEFQAGGALVIATSGTTGLPKLRVFDETRLLARVQNGVTLRAPPSGIMLNGYAPLSGPAHQHFLRALLSGQTQIFASSTDAATLAQVRASHCTEMRLPPRTFLSLCAAAEAQPATYALTKIFVGGGGISPEVALRGEALFGCPVITTYGSTETGSIAHTSYSGPDDQPGRVGRIYDGVEFALAEDGELRIRVAEGLRPLSYPERAPLTPDGWTGTGDIAEISPAGELVLIGRKSELLNLGGLKSAPARIEAEIFPFPGVKQIAVARVPLPSGLDGIGIGLVAGEGFAMATYSAHVAQRLPPGSDFFIKLVPELPHSSAGKIDRKALGQMIAATLSLTGAKG